MNLAIYRSRVAAGHARAAVAWRVLRCALLALLALFACVAVCTPVMAGTPGDTPALVGHWSPASAPDGTGRPFDPARLTAFGRPPGGARVLLAPRSGEWPAGPWVLSVESAGFQRVTLHLDGQPPQSARLLEPGDGARAAFGRLAFDVPVPPAGGAPLQLHVDARDAVPSPMNFVMRRPSAQVEAEARWLAFATACLATMAVTALIAGFFGLRLRDAAFGYYAAYVLAYVLIQSAQTGYLLRPLGWDAVAATLPAWGRAATTLSVVAAVLFLDRFVDLQARLPRLRRVLQAYCGLMLLLVVAGYVPGLQAAVRALINPMLILGGPLVLGAAVAAAWHGSRYAMLFLLGWVPLLAATVIGSLQLYGALPAWTWVDDAALAAGAFEALVLSIGLAERSASVRRQRDQARLLAQTDPLTGVLNRRAWREAVQSRLQARDVVSILFIDLDHFKHVNDALGHDAGDRVLRAFADVVREAVRERDMVGRYGGEEFVVALASATPAEALAIATRIRDGLRARGVGIPDRPLTVSIGIATRAGDEPLDALVQRADAALYAAKDAGRDRIEAG